MQHRERDRGSPSKGTRRTRAVLIAVFVLAATMVAWLILGEDEVSSKRGPSFAESSERDPASDLLDTSVSDPREGAPAGRSTLAPDRAHVVVNTRNAKTERPIRGLRVFAFGAEQDWWIERSYVEGRFGGLGESPTTDVAGIAMLEVEPGVPLRVTASCEGDHGWSNDAKLEPLAVGETREITIPIRSVLYRDFKLRVLAEENDRPLPGVRLLFKEHLDEDAIGSKLRFYPVTGRTIAVTDANGELDLPVDDWHPPVFDLVAEGREPVFVDTSAGYTSPELRLVVRLARAASLRGRVTSHREGFLPDTIRLQTESYWLKRPSHPHWLQAEPRWEGRILENGAFELHGLPTRVPLRAAWVANGITISAASPPLLLEPNESRRVEWSVGPGVTVIGQVVIPGEEVKPGLSVRLVPALEARYGGDYMHSGWTPVACALADESGRVRFERVAPGDWVIGLVPARPGSTASIDDATLAAYAVRFSVAPDQREITVVVPAHRGGFIEGHVVGDGDTPIISTIVEAQSLDGTGGDTWEGVEEDGSFRFGPLIPGLYRLEGNLGLWRGYGEFGGSLVVQAATGDHDVLIQEPPTGTVIGVAIDRATGEETFAQLFVYRHGSPQWVTMAYPLRRMGPEFEFNLRTNDIYDIRAETGDGRVGMLCGIRIEKGNPLENAKVLLERGEFVRLIYEGPTGCADYRFEKDGVTYASGEIQNGTRERPCLPIGSYEVTLTGQDGSASTISPAVVFEESRSIDVVRGEERIVEFRIAD